MSRLSCVCVLCEMETKLFADLQMTEESTKELFRLSQRLRIFSSATALLFHLKTSPANSDSDDVFRELLAVPASSWPLVETLLVLAFLPMIHRTTHCIEKRHRTLSRKDIAQEALSLLLQVLRSSEVHRRTSHFAFAISRATKRQLFVWAAKENSYQSTQRTDSDALLSALSAEDPFERHIWLRHFLNRCITSGSLSFKEMDFLIHFKLDESNGDSEASYSGLNTSNALRQRLKRLLAKLRRLARN